MHTRNAAALVSLVLAVALTGCTFTTTRETDAGEGPGSSVGSEQTAEGSGAAGMRLAPGLYDMQDGSVQAVGTLEYRDLEGGLWAIVGGTEAEGNIGTVVAVVNNPEKFTSELKTLTGKTVIVTGTRFEGASIRMAGPEVVVETIEDFSDTGGPAQ
jgi:hypothetical protein